MNDGCVCPKPVTCEYCYRMYPCDCAGCQFRAGLTRTRARTVRWPEAGSWRPSDEIGPGIGHPAPSEAQIAEGRTTTEKLPTVKEIP